MNLEDMLHDLEQVQDNPTQQEPEQGQPFTGICGAIQSIQQLAKVYGVTITKVSVDTGYDKYPLKILGVEIISNTTFECSNCHSREIKYTEGKTCSYCGCDCLEKYDPSNRINNVNEKIIQALEDKIKLQENIIDLISKIITK